jgi:CDP-diacylglycerol--serine O-phosphatidyltransferase
MKPVSMLPNLLTLANAGCGLLAICKAIDALASPEYFAIKMESACWLIFLAMVFDTLDGRLARLMQSTSEFGAQLDSFADALTFGIAPAIVAKVLLEQRDDLHPKLHFLAATAFALMAILRLARFNLETEADEESHSDFSGLPSPAAAGTVAATILMILSLGGGIEVVEGEATVVGKGLAILPAGFREGLVNVLGPGLALGLPVLGLLMVSRVRYVHLASHLFTRHGPFTSLVALVFAGLLLTVAPVPLLFLAGVGYVAWGALSASPLWRRPAASSPAAADAKRVREARDR